MTVYRFGQAQPIRLSDYRRLVVWFSCGAASACAAKLALDHVRGSGIETVLAYTDPGSEHPDNPRFIADVERWLGHPVTVLRSDRYADTWAVWEARRHIAGLSGAPCTTELKKALRERFERDGDLQVFGYDATERKRIARFSENQPEVALWCPLADAGASKDLCFMRLQEAGIALPAMYLLGYKNNNCIGCPKGNAGYWNKIRRDFPDTFERMAVLEGELGVRICQATIGGERRRVSLRELPTSAGVYSDEPPLSCGLFCSEGGA
jgi:hypothetical protein